MKEQKKKRKKGFIDYLIYLIIIVCLASAAFSGYKVLSIQLNYKQARDEYKAIEKSAVIKNEIVEGTVAEPEKEVVKKELKAPIKVDHKSLKEKNKDYVGWLYIEALDNISYPILHGETNDTYLHTTFNGEYLFAGSIFIDFENHTDMMDPNTVIYGHNMKDTSMFGILRDMYDRHLYDESPYIWVLTENGDYKYKIFSIQFCLDDGPVYTFFKEPGKNVKEYFDKMKAASAVDFGEFDYTEDSKCITLSTCVAADGPDRFVIQAFKIDGEGNVDNEQYHRTSETNR